MADGSPPFVFLLSLILLVLSNVGGDYPVSDVDPILL